MCEENTVVKVVVFIGTCILIAKFPFVGFIVGMTLIPNYAEQMKGSTENYRLINEQSKRNTDNLRRNENLKKHNIAW